MTLPKSLTTVTQLSKTLALILLVALPFIGFYFGTQYQKTVDSADQQIFVATSSQQPPVQKPQGQLPTKQPFDPAQGRQTPAVKPSLSPCLSDASLDAVVDSKIVTWYNDGRPPVIDKVTVEQKLAELKASCRSDNKLVDGSGKEITFYHLIGCWGNPPYDYQEILKKQEDEIHKLKEQYTVVEMTCNPSGIPIP